jgi:hypothetical protein
MQKAKFDGACHFNLDERYVIGLPWKKDSFVSKALVGVTREKFGKESKQSKDV